MKTIPVWIVEGHTGEYSDRHQWTVAACATEQAAQKLEDECMEWAKALGIDIGRGDAAWGDEAVRAINDGLVPEAPDQGIQTDYTGTDYVMYKLDLRINDVIDCDEFADALIQCRAELSK